MRRLLYIPILHAEADLGSLAATLSQQTIALLGEKRWAKHQEIVFQFWRVVANHLITLDLAALRIYQDGLAADGGEGLRVAEEAAKRGSPNYQLLLKLVQQGAVLRKTEDAALLLRERQNLLKAMEKSGEGMVDRESYRGQRDSLMEARDWFIARTINETLQEGEIGVLFLGAFHEVLAKLASDIEVHQVVPQERVRAYFSALLLEVDERRWQALANDLIGFTHA